MYVCEARRENQLQDKVGINWSIGQSQHNFDRFLILFVTNGCKLDKKAHFTKL